METLKNLVLEAKESIRKEKNKKIAFYFLFFALVFFFIFITFLILKENKGLMDESSVVFLAFYFLVISAVIFYLLFSNKLKVPVKITEKEIIIQIEKIIKLKENVTSQELFSAEKAVSFYQKSLKQRKKDLANKRSLYQDLVRLKEKIKPYSF